MATRLSATLHPTDNTRREEGDPLALESVLMRSAQFAQVQAVCTKRHI